MSNIQTILEHSWRNGKTVCSQEPTAIDPEKDGTVREPCGRCVSILESEGESFG